MKIVARTPTELILRDFAVALRIMGVFPAVREFLRLEPSPAQGPPAA